MHSAGDYDKITIHFLVEPGLVHVEVAYAVLDFYKMFDIFETCTGVGTLDYAYTRFDLVKHCVWPFSLFWGLFSRKCSFSVRELILGSIPSVGVRIHFFPSRRHPTIAERFSGVQIGVSTTYKMFICVY